MFQEGGKLGLKWRVVHTQWFSLIAHEEMGVADVHVWREGAIVCKDREVLDLLFERCVILCRTLWLYRYLMCSFCLTPCCCSNGANLPGKFCCLL